MDDDGDDQDNTEGKQGAAKGPQLFSSNVEAQEILQVRLCSLSLQPLHCIPDSTPHSIARGGAWQQRSIQDRTAASCSHLLTASHLVHRTWRSSTAWQRSSPLS